MTTSTTQLEDQLAARAKEMRRFVELLALGNVISNVAEFASGHLYEVSFDTILVSDGRKSHATATATDVAGALWGADTDYEELPEFQQAEATATGLASDILARLTSDDGREILGEMARRFDRIANDQTRKLAP